MPVNKTSSGKTFASVTTVTATKNKTADSNRFEYTIFFNRVLL